MTKCQPKEHFKSTINPDAGAISRTLSGLQVVAADRGVLTPNVAPGFSPACAALQGGPTIKWIPASKLVLPGLLLLCLLPGGTLVAQDPTTILKNSFGKDVVVTDVVDIPEQIPTDKFWSMIHPSKKLGREQPVWLNPLLRDYFFGKYRNTETADPVKECDRLLELPHATGMMGKPVDPARPLIIADDLPFHPIMRAHPGFSTRYYPRRMHDWVFTDFQPAYLARVCDIGRRIILIAFVVAPVFVYMVH